MTDTIPNRGDAGAALDASVAGLARVEGPAIWWGAYTSNYLLESNADYPPQEWTEYMDVRFGAWMVPEDGETTRPLTSTGFISKDGGTGNRGWYVGLNTNGAITTLTTCDDQASANFQQTANDILPAEYWNRPILLRMNFDRLRNTYKWFVKPTMFASLDADLADDDGWTLLEESAQLSNPVTEGGGSTTEFRYGRAGGNSAGEHHGLGYRVVFDGLVQTSLTSADIAGAAPDAASVSTSSGNTLTVTRASSGPVTTIVPGGVEYINPDDGDQANSVVVPGDVALDIPAGEDGVIFWAGRISNLGSTFVFVVEWGLTGDARIGMLLQANLNVEVRLDIRTTNGASSSAATYIEVGQDDLVVLALVMDRSTDLARWRSYTQAGLLDSTDRSISGVVGSIDGSLGGRILSRVPGTVSSFLFDRGVGVAPSDEEVAAMAAALIAQMQRDPISSTGALPPAGHKVRGDRYRANNGHTAQFNGASWDAVTPAVGNLAALLANSDLLVGGASV